MKKLSIIFFLLISANCYGQFTKGLYGIGLQADFRSMITAKGWDNSDNKEFQILPTFQYWLNNNFSVAGGVGYGYGDNVIFQDVPDHTGISRTHRLPFLASIRYWHPIEYFNNRLFIYGQFSPQFSLGYNKSEFRNDTRVFPPQYSRDFLTNINLSAGLLLFITKRFGMDVNVGGFDYYNLESRGIRGLDSRGTNHHNFRFNFSPMYWKVGGFFLLNSKSINLTND